MTLVMGIDGGGTRTVAVVVDDALKELGRGEAGPANYHNVGLESVQDAVRLAAERTCQRAGCRLEDLSALGCGLAGAGRPEDQHVLRQALAEALPISPLGLTHDAEIALVGGTGHREGVVVISGTGSMAYGMSATGARARAGGWGPILDDRGSGFWIGRRALRHAVLGYERRGPATALGKEIVSVLALSRMEDLIRWASTKGSVQEIAGLAPLVDRCAQAGDRVAQQILWQAGSELAGLVEAVLSQLAVPDADWEVVLTGGTFQHQPMVTEAFYEELTRLAPRARPTWPAHEPVVGAALLALMELEADERDPD